MRDASGMTVVTRHAPGTPSFVDLSTTDPDAAQAFYGSLFGWSYENVMPEGAGSYLMASLDGHIAAAIAPQQEAEAAAGVPSHWQVYITVDDVDAATGKVAGAGGTVHVEPFDVFDAGRMSVIQDPVGAFVCLWQPGQSIGSEIVNVPGAFTWEDLIAPGVKTTADFYETVVGLRLIDMATGGDAYFGWSLDGTENGAVGGAMEPPMPGMPAHWMVYFGTADVDGDTAKVTEMGGSVLAPPFDIPVGRMAVVADPQGAIFSMIQLNTSAQ